MSETPITDGHARQILVAVRELRREVAALHRRMDALGAQVARIAGRVAADDLEQRSA